MTDHLTLAHDNVTSMGHVTLARDNVRGGGYIFFGRGYMSLVYRTPPLVFLGPILMGAI